MHKHKFLLELKTVTGHTMASSISRRLSRVLDILAACVPDMGPAETRALLGSSAAVESYVLVHVDRSALYSLGVYFFHSRRLFS